MGRPYDKFVHFVIVSLLCHCTIKLNKVIIILTPYRGNFQFSFNSHGDASALLDKKVQLSIAKTEREDNEKFMSFDIEREDEESKIILMIENFNHASLFVK